MEGQNLLVLALLGHHGAYLSHRKVLKKPARDKNETFWVHSPRGRGVVVASVGLLAPFSVIVDGIGDGWSQFSVTVNVELGPFLLFVSLRSRYGVPLWSAATVMPPPNMANDMSI